MVPVIVRGTITAAFRSVYAHSSVFTHFGIRFLFSYDVITENSTGFTTHYATPDGAAVASFHFYNIYVGRRRRPLRTLVYVTLTWSACEFLGESAALGRWSSADGADLRARPFGPRPSRFRGCSLAKLPQVGSGRRPLTPTYARGVLGPPQVVSVITSWRRRLLQELVVRRWRRPVWLVSQVLLVLWEVVFPGECFGLRRNRTPFYVSSRAAK